ncbi:MAG: deoxynucleoside kinase, partial [Gammaproteobacteria bacterium]|nr:deoxynucleoside kinase [Gammaproteobacteria bacterium]
TMSSTPSPPNPRAILRRNLRRRLKQNLPTLVSISGNIGVGKSTVLKELRARGYDIISEGVDRGAWKNLLQKYYADPKKYAFIFQATILADMFQELASDARRPEMITVAERCPIDTLAFASVIFEDGNLTIEEFDVLKKLVSTSSVKPDIIVHLRLAPAACLARIKQRGRVGESDITLGYLERLNSHTTSTLREHASRIRIVDVDVGSLSPRDLADKIEEIIWVA